MVDRANAMYVTQLMKNWALLFDPAPLCFEIFGPNQPDVRRGGALDCGFPEAMMTLWGCSWSETMKVFQYLNTTNLMILMI